MANFEVNSEEDDDADDLLKDWKNQRFKNYKMDLVLHFSIS